MVFRIEIAAIERERSTKLICCGISKCEVEFRAIISFKTCVYRSNMSACHVGNNYAN